MAENPRIEELRRRVQADPASIAFAALAEEFRRVGRYDDAIETCRTGLQRHPAYLSARVTLGRALIETGDFDGAREELETVLRSAPENLAAIRGLAQIHERLGHSTEMDPHLADMMKTMHAESIRVAAQPPPPPPPIPVKEAYVAPVVEPDEDRSSANPETMLDPRDSNVEPQIKPELDLTQLEDRGPRIEDRSWANPEAILDPRTSNPDRTQLEDRDPRIEDWSSANPETILDPRTNLDRTEDRSGANPETILGPRDSSLDPEPSFDLALAPPLGLASSPDPDLALTALTLDPEPDVEVLAGPDPEMLATLARLERFLGAIQSLRS